MQAENAIIFEGATADAYETTLSIVDHTADHTQYLINQGGYIPLLAAATRTAISSTPAELNLLDGSSANSVVNSKAVVYGSSGEIAATTLTASGNVTGALINATGDTSANNNAAIGYTSAEGLILTGQGSTNDITIKNDADTTVIQIPTGTTGVTLAGTLGVTGVLTGTSLDISGAIDIDGTSNLDVVDIDGAVDMASTLAVAGVTTLATHLVMGDSDIIKLGADADLQIYHDGSHSYINNIIGDLKIQNSSAGGDIYLNPADSEVGLKVVENGAVSLYYDNAAKLATVTGGINITGDTDTDTLTVSGNATVGGTLGVTGLTTLTGNLTMMSNTIYANQAYVHDRLGHLNDADTYIDFGVDTITFAAGGERMRIDSSGNVGIGETSPDNLLHIKSSASDVTMIKLENTNAGAYPGRITFVQNSASPADNDALGKIDFYGEDSAGNSDRFAFILALALDVTSGTEDGLLSFQTLVNGTNVNTMNIKGGYVGIGTDVPNGHLDVRGTGYFNNTLHMTGSSYLQWTGGAYWSLQDTNSSNDFRFTTVPSGGAEHFRIAADGTLTATDTTIGSNSDSRLKENIENYSYDINKFKSYEPRLFDWINPGQHGNKSQQIGFIAQEQEIIDERFIDNIKLDAEDKVEDNPDIALIDADRLIKTSKFGQIDAMYISVIQQLITRIETAEAKIATLEG